MAVKDWSTTAASNTTLGALSTQGTAPANTIDNLFREIMAQLATFFIDANFQLDSTDAGATAGPTLKLYRNSATPAAADVIGQVLFQGEDGAGNTEDYAAIDAVIDDPTSTSEDATLRLRTVVAGTMTTSLALTGTTATMTSTDAGATAAPIIDLYRDSATPAASDLLGEIQFNGEDSAGNKQIYASISGLVDDPTSTSEDGGILFKAVSGGALTNALTVYAGVHQVNGGGTTPKIATDGDDNEFIVQGGVTASQGGSIHLFGSSHASAAGDVWLVTGSTTVYQWDNSESVNYFPSTVRFGQNSTSSPGASNNTAGAAMGTGVLYLSSAAQSLSVNVTSDGILQVLRSGGTSQGTISVSGATITYGTFNGSHEAQLADGVDRSALLCGTILETVDEQCNWYDEPDRVLPKVRISDTPGSKRVYGVFFDWYGSDPEDDTANSSSLGAYVIRIASGVTVQGGDLIESNGDGCGRVQADDIVRASTVAKVTSNVIAETYPDGSYLVPCTLHCG